MSIACPSSPTHNPTSLAIMSEVNPENVLRTLKILLLEKVNLQPQPCLFD